jgi:hypothetical protein
LVALIVMIVLIIIAFVTNIITIPVNKLLGLLFLMAPLGLLFLIALSEPQFLVTILELQFITKPHKLPFLITLWELLSPIAQRKQVHLATLQVRQYLAKSKVFSIIFLIQASILSPCV